MRRLFRRRNRNIEIEPDEIFMDSSNIPQFDTQQFEGRLEKPLARSNVVFLGSAFVIIALIFIWKAGILSIKKGDEYLRMSQNNSLKGDPMFADRGVIYDRNGIELAWNTIHPNGEEYLFRSYIDNPGFSNLLGYIGYPSRDSSGKFWQTEYQGKDGIEKMYDDLLQGVNGKKLYETNARGEVSSISTTTPPVHGENVFLSIDSRIQAKLYESIVNLADRAGYRGGAGLIMDVANGELIALTTYPEYDSEIMSTGDNKEAIQGYLTDTTKRSLFNRAIEGVYTPGSIVKPFIALGALTEGVVTPETSFYSSGELVLPNPYNPELNSIFRDWQEEGHGYTSLRKAIAESVNTYFYIVGGGYRDQKGLGISKIELYIKMFGIGADMTGVDVEGEKIGNVPSPAWKSKIFPGDPWRVGDTYHTAIGQYGFLVTPIQMLRAVGGIATEGTLVRPHLIKNDASADEDKAHLLIPKEHYAPVKEGMRMVVTDGTGGSLNVSNIEIAAKTGTAQVGISKNHINSWVIGFFPYDNPRYAFTVLMESSPSSNKAGAAQAMGELVRWMEIYAPEYFE